MKGERRSQREVDKVESSKVGRILDIYTRLLEGEAICKEKEAEYFKVSERSIQRDIEDIQIYLEEVVLRDGEGAELVYDRGTKSYYLERNKGE